MDPLLLKIMEALNPLADDVRDLQREPLFSGGSLGPPPARGTMVRLDANTRALLARKALKAVTDYVGERGDDDDEAWAAWYWLNQRAIALGAD